MEPVTHLLTGACLARCGFRRRAAYATAVMVVAAEFPDIDTLWSLRGPVEGFAHHRGITHTFVGVPLEAALLVAAAYGVHRWRVARARRQSPKATPDSRPVDPTTETVQRPLTAAPVRWGLLYAGALLALLSHLWLDYTNNYGLRPFFPFDRHWYAGSFVFIVDPVLLVLLAGGLLMPLLFRLIGSEVGERRRPFRGSGWAVAALLGMVAWWSFRYVEHARAVQLAMAQTLPTRLDAESADSAAESTEPAYLRAQRVLASPDPLDPFTWSTVADYGAVYALAEVDTQNSAVDLEGTTYPKPAATPTVRAAEASPLGRAYMDWSSMPILSVAEIEPDMAPYGPPGGRQVIFRDPRFMGGWLREHQHAALTGVVTLDAAGQVVRQSMDGRAEH